MPVDSAAVLSYVASLNESAVYAIPHEVTASDTTGTRSAYDRDTRSTSIHISGMRNDNFHVRVAPVRVAT